MGEMHFLGKGRIQLLEGIREYGSISRAARRMKMSYKAAWDAINEINNLYDTDLIVSESGGKRGGGTTLTEDGIRLVEIFRAVEREINQFIGRINMHIDDTEDVYTFLRRISMKTSAANQFFGNIIQVKKGAVNSEIILALRGDDRITAIVTNESVSLLGLKKGIDAYALVNSSWVIIVKDEGELKSSARNKLTGKITKIRVGKVNSDVLITLDGGNTVSSVITNESLEELGLKNGDRVTAIFKASSVIIGVV
jgi:molybdate transport system regulatory protein